MNMSGYIAPSLVNAIIDAYFRGYPSSDPELSFLIGDDFFAALLVSSPIPWDYQTYYFDGGQEVSYTGYSRVLMSRGLSSFKSTQNDSSVSSGSSGETSNSSTVYFPVCTTSSQLVTHVALCGNGLAGSSSYAHVYWELDDPIQLSSSSPGVYPTIPAGALRFRIDN